MVNVGPTVAPTIAALVRAGVGTIRLVGDRPVTELDVQQSRHFGTADVGTLFSEVLRRALEVDRREATIESDRELPDTKLAWQEKLANVDIAYAPTREGMPFVPWIDALNEAALDTGTPWMISSLISHEEIYIGPTFIPGVTACFKCFEMRYKSHLGGYDAYLEFEQHIRKSGESRDFGHFPPYGDLAATFVVRELLAALSPDETPHTIGKMLTLLGPSLSTETDPLLPLPRCFSCSPTRNAPESRIWSTP